MVYDLLGNYDECSYIAHQGEISEILQLGGNFIDLSSYSDDKDTTCYSESAIAHYHIHGFSAFRCCIEL